MLSPFSQVAHLHLFFSFFFIYLFSFIYIFIYGCFPTVLWFFFLVYRLQCPLAREISAFYVTWRYRTLISFILQWVSEWVSELVSEWVSEWVSESEWALYITHIWRQSSSANQVTSATKSVVFTPVWLWVGYLKTLWTNSNETRWTGWVCDWMNPGRKQ